MQRSRRHGRSRTDELPRTLQRSCPEAQAVFATARQEAVQAYGESDEAYRAAYAALKQKFEKRGDQWIAKAEPA